MTLAEADEIPARRADWLLEIDRVVQEEADRQVAEASRRAQEGR